jgi:short-subunit dehydrogenase
MNIVITGAGKGIGYETALLLAADSNNSVIGISRNEMHLKKLSEKSKGAIKTLCYDFKMYKGIPTLLVPEIRKLTRHVDVIINNAGLLTKKNIEQVSANEIEESYAVNVFSHILLIKDLLPLMGGKTRTHIVNISSIGGVQGSVKFPGLSIYSSTKAAIINLTECLAAELKEKNIIVNCLAFGSVQTEMFGNAFPLTKASISTVEAAKYISEFCTSGWKYFNGKVVEVSNSIP